MTELKIQLGQLYGALGVADETEKAELQNLIQDLEALIQLSPGGTGNILLLGGSHSGTGAGQNSEIISSSQPNDSVRDPFVGDEDGEFARFQKEISCLENKDLKDSDSTEPYLSNNTSSSNEYGERRANSDDSAQISELLSSLEGMKCRAPFEHHWGQRGYHNAIVFSAERSSEGSSSFEESGESVAVRVVFAQPMTEAMRPCQFFLEGRCRFSDDECKFSHGELLALPDLKDYSEPNFSAIVPGTRILAKYTDELWYHATVAKFTETGDCEITYDSYNEKSTIPIHDTFPLNEYSDEDNEELSLSSDNSSSENEINQSDLEDTPLSDEVWNHMSATSALGQWERHTKGIGSKLMQKMGYVLGSGLGKAGEGRVEPIDAVILPHGRSLDKCMELKEHSRAHGNANLFSVEKRLKRIQRKEKLKAEKLQDKVRQSESVFGFLNSHLNLSKGLKKSKVAENLNKESVVNLNKKLLHVGESIKQVKKDIAKCKEGMKRHEGRDQAMVERMKGNLSSLETKLADLERNEVSIAGEQRHRSDKKKFSIF